MATSTPGSRELLLSFVLTNDRVLPPAAAIVERSLTFGLGVEVVPGPSDEQLLLRLEGGERILLRWMNAPLPNVEKHPSGPTSLAPAALAEARFHVILASPELMALSHTSPVLARTLLSVVTAAVVAACEDAVAAVVSPGDVFHRASQFLALAARAATSAALPAPLLMDITIEPEADDRVSLLTHGLADHGRAEELLITCPQADASSSFDLLCSLVEHMVNEPSFVPPVGDTIGRDERERIPVGRAPSPTGRGEVLHLNVA